MNRQLPASALRRIDAVCDDYEAAWRGGRQPRIEDYLLFCDLDERSRLLDLLQELQQELILKQMAVGATKAVPAQTMAMTAPKVLTSIPAASQSTQSVPPPRLNTYKQLSGSGQDIETPLHKIGHESTHNDGLASQTEVWDPPRVVLRVVAGPHQGQEFIYDEHDTLLVGRSNLAQLRLQDDMHFSRHHFRLEANPPECFLMDLGSRNGTFVNGERITERDLKGGDIVSGGRTKMVVYLNDPRQAIRKFARYH